MKNILFAAICLMVPDVSNAHWFSQPSCCCPSPPVYVKCASPCDVFKGVGNYSINVTRKMAHGAGEILCAPFKTNICIPQRHYRYYPGYYVPGRLEEIREVRPVPMPVPVPDLGTPAKAFAYNY